MHTYTNGVLHQLTGCSMKIVLISKLGSACIHTRQQVQKWCPNNLVVTAATDTNTDRLKRKMHKCTWRGAQQWRHKDPLVIAAPTGSSDRLKLNMHLFAKREAKHWEITF